MPSAESILGQSTTIANEWRSVAVAWHIALLAGVGAVLLGWRPSVRAAARILVMPTMSVSVTAFFFGNPFTAIVFAALTALLAGVASRLPTTSIGVTSPLLAIVGVTVFAVGAAYPHFLIVQTPVEYAYAAPLGLLPCPTLLAVTGLTLVFAMVKSKAWSAPLIAASLLYGLIGVFRLAVLLDIVLLGAALALALAFSAGKQESASAQERPSSVGRAERGHGFV